MKNPFDHHLHLVTYPRQQGNEAAARTFQTPTPTVRK